jgi:hypothetical protein
MLKSAAIAVVAVLATVSLTGVANAATVTPGTLGPAEQTEITGFADVIKDVQKTGPINAAVDVMRTGLPEPESWALMILGFGGVGALIRRGRRARPIED